MDSKTANQKLATECVTTVKAPYVEDAAKLETSVLVHDGIRTDIDRKGNDLQRPLVFALIKAWAVIIKEEREKCRAEDVQRRSASYPTYFIFEEPELFLHPQAPREILCLWHSRRFPQASHSRLVSHKALVAECCSTHAGTVLLSDNPSLLRKIPRSPATKGRDTHCEVICENQAAGVETRPFASQR